MAVLLVRALDEAKELQRSVVFQDVPLEYWANPYIAKAHELKLMGHYLDNTFRPQKTVSRAEAITFILRMDQVKEENEIEENPYKDISKDFWAARAIKTAKKLNYLKPFPGPFLKPAYPLTRLELAIILAESTIIKKKIQSLIDWSSK